MQIISYYDCIFIGAIFSIEYTINIKKPMSLQKNAFEKYLRQHKGDLYNK